MRQNRNSLVKSEAVKKYYLEAGIKFGPGRFLTTSPPYFDVYLFKVSLGSLRL